MNRKKNGKRADVENRLLSWWLDSSFFFLTFFFSCRQNGGATEGGEDFSTDREGGLGGLVGLNLPENSGRLLLDIQST